MNKFTIFREMLETMSRISDVTDANMNYLVYCDGSDLMKIVGENEGKTITVEVTIKKKEENEDA